MALDTERIVLGTAQLGMPYGIANRIGQPDRETVYEIIRAAWKCGVRIFDTAQGYGASEEVLGDALHHHGLLSQARIITKFHPPLNHLDRKALQDALATSLQKLGVEQLEGVFFHREELLDLWNQGLGEFVQDLKNSGFTRSVGISVYSPKKALLALEKEGIESVQLPTNMLDRRFEHAGVFEKAKELNKQIYIRSVYLQGLLLLDPENLSEKMQFAREALQTVKTLCRKYQLSAQELALGYIKESFPDAYIAIGSETPLQVEENCKLWERVTLPQALLQEIRDTFPSVDERILNPSKW